MLNQKLWDDADMVRVLFINMPVTIMMFVEFLADNDDRILIKIVRSNAPAEQNVRQLLHFYWEVVFTSNNILIICYMKTRYQKSKIAALLVFA